MRRARRPGAACTTVIFQNGLFVCTCTIMRFVLLVAVKVKGRPFGEVAVTGMMSDLPAGMVTLPMGSMTGAARAHCPSANIKTAWRTNAGTFMPQNIAHNRKTGDYFSKWPS